MPSQIENIIDQNKRLGGKPLSILKKPRFQRFPNSIERLFARDLNQMVSNMVTSVKTNIFPQLESILSEANALRPKQDGIYQRLKFKYKMKFDVGDRIDELVNATRIGIDNEFTTNSISMELDDVALRTSNFNRTQLSKVLQSALGVDVFFNEPYLTQELQAFTRSNVTLIKSIPQQYFNDVNRIVFSGVREGLTAAEVQKNIRKRTKTTRNRAKLIARDQMNKLNGQLTQLRQESIGVKSYIWRTVLDERVRPSHAARDGDMIRWDNPPFDGHPGQPINCRCFAQPNLEEFLN